jgi:hypothetical protein
MIQRILRKNKVETTISLLDFWRFKIVIKLLKFNLKT